MTTRDVMDPSLHEPAFAATGNSPNTPHLLDFRLERSPPPIASQRQYAGRRSVGPRKSGVLDRCERASL